MACHYLIIFCVLHGTVILIILIWLMWCLVPSFLYLSLARTNCTVNRSWSIIYLFSTSQYDWISKFQSGPSWNLQWPNERWKTQTFIPQMITAIGSLSGTNGFRRVPPCIYLTNFEPFNQANGPLTAENVFDYFSHSMFYDKQSNNQVLRMQTMHTGQPVLNEAEELKWDVVLSLGVVQNLTRSR